MCMSSAYFQNMFPSWQAWRSDASMMKATGPMPDPCAEIDIWWHPHGFSQHPWIGILDKSLLVWGFGYMPISGMMHPGKSCCCPDILIFILPTYVRGPRFIWGSLDPGGLRLIISIRLFVYYTLRRETERPTEIRTDLIFWPSVSLSFFFCSSFCMALCPFCLFSGTLRRRLFLHNIVDELPEQYPRIIIHKAIKFDCTLALCELCHMLRCLSNTHVQDTNSSEWWCHYRSWCMPNVIVYEGPVTQFNKMNRCLL